MDGALLVVSVLNFVRYLQGKNNYWKPNVAPQRMQSRRAAVMRDTAGVKKRFWL